MKIQPRDIATSSVKAKEPKTGTKGVWAKLCGDCKARHFHPVRYSPTQGCWIGPTRPKEYNVYYRNDTTPGELEVQHPLTYVS